MSFVNFSFDEENHHLHHNHSEHHHFSNFAKHLLSSLYALLMILSCVGNLTVCIVILKTKSMRNFTNVLFVNLGIIDIGYGTSSCISAVLFDIELFSHPHGQTGILLCILSTNIRTLGFLLSSFTITAVCLERFVAITKPHQSRSKWTTRIKQTLFVIWIGAIVVIIPFFYFTKFLEEKEICQLMFPSETASVVCVFLLALIGLLLPVFFLLYAYLKIVQSLWFRKDVGPFQQILLKSRRTVTVTLGIVSAVFIVCRTPYLIYFLLICLQKSSNQTLGYILVALLCSFSACLNPVIYSFRSPQFTKSLRAMCCKTGVIRPYANDCNDTGNQAAGRGDIASKLFHLKVSAQRGIEDSHSVRNK